MAHELTLRADGRAEMAFVGETPWHKLGQNVTKGAPLSVWLKEAGMDWEARRAVPMFTPILGNNQANAPRPAEDYGVIYRSDTGAPLSIMGSGYQIVQPKQVLEFMREEIEGGGWYIHTAGTLRGGRKLWAMATREGGIQAINPKAKAGNRDEVVNNILIATSLDGSMRTTVQRTSIRVVCANTLAMALAGSTGDDRVEISHRSVFNPRAIKRALGVADESFDIFIRQARELAETSIDVTQAKELLSQVFKPAETKEKIDLSWMGNLADLGKPQEPEPKSSRSLERILALFQGEGMGAHMKTSEGTRWGLLNAVTQYVDHEMGRTDDTRIDGAWFGRGSSFKTQAFNLLTTEA